MNILEQVIKTAIETTNDCPDDETRLIYATKEDAETISEELKEYWPKGFGQMYGPFVSEKSGYKKWWEVSIPRQTNLPVS